MKGVNVLVAYPYATDPILNRLKEFRDRGANVLIDSGAFSAWNAGKEIKLVDYVAFLKNLPFEPTGYFQLDVVGDRDATLKNLEIMVRGKLKPIAVFQRGMPESDIEAMYELAEIVAVGGLGGSQDKPGFCKWFMARTKGRKAHLLGHVSPATIAATKPHSCDSTNWMFGTRGLQVMVYGGRGIRYGICKGKFRNRKIKKDGFKILASYGVTETKMRTDRFWKNDIRVLGARSIIRMSADTETRFGSFVYAAANAIGDLNWLEHAWELEGAILR